MPFLTPAELRARLAALQRARGFPVRPDPKPSAPARRQLVRVDLDDDEAAPYLSDEDVACGLTRIPSADG